MSSFRTSLRNSLAEIISGISILTISVAFIVKDIRDSKQNKIIEDNIISIVNEHQKLSSIVEEMRQNEQRILFSKTESYKD